MSSVTAVGSAALDTIETPFGRVEEALGGSVFYIAAVGGIFAPVNIVCVVGNDFDKENVAFLSERNVNLEGMEVKTGKTFRWEGLYHKNMNQRDTISTKLGVFEGFNPILPDHAAGAEYLLLANIAPELQLSVLSQMKATRFIAFDTMNLWININRNAVEEVMTKVDLVTINDEELFMLTGEKSILTGAKKLLEFGPEYIIIKKGEHGSMLVTKNAPPFICPAYPIEKPIDPTGAGDTFAGALMGYLAATRDVSPMNMRRAVVYGSVAASFSVEAFSLDRLKTLDANQLHERYRQYKELVEF